MKNKIAEMKFRMELKALKVRFDGCNATAKALGVVSEAVDKAHNVWLDKTVQAGNDYYDRADDSTKEGPAFESFQMDHIEAVAHLFEKTGFL